MRAALLEKTNDATAEALEWISPPPSKRRLTAASAVCIGGSVALAVAAIGLALGITSGESSPDGSTEARAASPAAEAVAAPGSFPDVGVTDLSYLPGHSSGWHVHPGVHSVVVLAGTLTVYDESCGRTDYGLGQTYLGGSRAHLVRNEGGDVLTVAVTYVYAGATKTDHGGVVSAPAGCEPR